ncbi:SDR family oxidoreductase [soil metagenome]
MAQYLVTGASRGIGLALCRELVTRGDDVVATCRRPSAELESLSVRVEAGIDVADPAAASRLAERLDGLALDVLINNAGINRRQKLGDIDESAVSAMIELYRVNSLGPLLVTQALLGQLGSGAKVAFITSRMGSIADNTSGGAYGYRMSKAALNIAAVSLARDLEPKGIAVVLLHPGYVRTDMTGGHGDVDSADAARGLLARIDELDSANSGNLWHANGEKLPW